MNEKYQGKIHDTLYTGEKINIRYNDKRCIHAEECLKRRGGVFDRNRDPWIQPDEHRVEDIVDAVERCPSGALHYERKDGIEETSPSENRIIVCENGPLQLQGDLAIGGLNVSIVDEHRATLCRCGASNNKPFCDNMHKEIDFIAEEVDTVRIDTDKVGGKLIITATHNGPLQVQGNFQIETRKGKLIYTGTKTWLCRCGNSQSKPFCDSSHNLVNFNAD
jgi:CDGSH-type Zn-finger protein/uncharacterized Fe-S cluster protein YjdI